MGSIFKKIKSIAKNGLDPVLEGKYNLENPTLEIEEEAKRRFNMCDCDIDEPISFLKIKDERVPEFSGKICKECSCALPYLLRQNIKICKNWET